MANIKISEQDLTSAGSTNTTENYAYIPGYAIMGPINEPTVCETLSDFQRIFGSVPYRFKNQQSYQTITFAQANDYEKSYIYASELLRAGLPIVFERVPSLNLSYATTRINFDLYKVSSLSEIYKNDFTIDGYKVERATDEDGGVIENTYRINVELPSGSGIYAYNAESDITITVGSNQYTKVANNITVADTYITFTSETSINGIDSTDGVTASITYDLVNTIYYTLSAKFDLAKNAIEWTLQYRKDTDSTLTKVESFTVTGYDLISNTKTANIIVNVGQFSYPLTFSNLTLLADTDTNVYLDLRAKYPGSYANGALSVDTSVVRGNGSALYFKLVAQLNLNGTITVDSPTAVTISFDDLDSRYYKNATSSLFDIVDTNVSNVAINIGLLSLTADTKTFEYADLESDEFNVSDFYKQLEGYTDQGVTHSSIFTKLSDRSEYSIKFITSGGYPVFNLLTSNSIVDTMLLTAANRGDAAAIIDHADQDPTSLYSSANDYFKRLTTLSDNGEDIKKYGTMFTPWASYQMVTINEVVDFPASFAYLKSLAVSTKTNANWYAVSGVTRGLVSGLLQLKQKVTGAIADMLQARTGVSINPITYIRPYGYCVWGNRTLFNNIDDLTASSFLNIRILSSDVKKVVYTAARRLTFELNDDTLWLNFKSAIEPTLDAMKSGNGLSKYKITKLTATEKATVKAKIRLWAIEPVEDWDITIELADSYTTVE